MAHFGSASPKPEQGWTNNRYFSKLNRGPLKKADKDKCSIKTVRKTISKTNGRVGYVGTSELKGTQWGPHLFLHASIQPTFQLFQHLKYMIQLYIWMDPLTYYGLVSKFSALRVYPVPFAEKIKELLPDLTSKAEGMPVIPIDDNTSGPETFENMVWSTWDEAHLMPCIRYLRGAKDLQVGYDWKNAFPPAFEVLHRLESKSQGSAQGWNPLFHLNLVVSQNGPSSHHGEIPIKGWKMLKTKSFPKNMFFLQFGFGREYPCCGRE